MDTYWIYTSPGRATGDDRSNNSTDSAQCSVTERPAGRRLVCAEAADTTAHVLLGYPCLFDHRLRAPGNIVGAAHNVQRDGVVVALAIGYATAPTVSEGNHHQLTAARSVHWI